MRDWYTEWFTDARLLRGLTERLSWLHCSTGQAGHQDEFFLYGAGNEEVVEAYSEAQAGAPTQEPHPQKQMECESFTYAAVPSFCVQLPFSVRLASGSSTAAGR